MRHTALIAAALASGLVLNPFSSLSAAEPDAAAVAALAGGSPLPAGTHTIAVPNHPKQSISFRSDADEVIVGTIAFSGEGALGSVTIDASAGTGSASLSIPVAAMTTGNTVRDEHLRSPDWLDAASHPNITFTDVTLTRVADTVYQASGTWTMRGVSQPMTTLANVRFIPSFPRFGDNVVRVRADFAIDLKAFGLNHPGIGTPAVAQVWTVSVALLGKVQ